MKIREATAFRRGDAVTIAVVIAAALALLLAVTLRAGSAENLRVEIWHNGARIRELSLQQDAEITVEGDYTNVIRVLDGRVSMAESDCPGKDCVHSGWISRNGRSIVCLPNRVEIRVVGGKADEDDVDAVVQ